MFLRAEPWFKELFRRLFSPWKGNHIVYGDLSVGTAVAAANVIPWGFVSQEKVLESVTPDRAAGGGKTESRKVEKRAEYLNLDTWEFLRGAEEAYRCTAKLFAQQHQHRHHHQQKRSLKEAPTTATPAHGQAVGVSESEETESGVGRDWATSRSQTEEEGGTTMTDFCDFDIASPQMSMFLNDVLESYRVQGLVPRLSVASVEAKLCKVGVRFGGVSKNTNFMGLMSAEEARYHLTMGMVSANRSFGSLFDVDLMLLSWQRQPRQLRNQLVWMHPVCRLVAAGSVVHKSGYLTSHDSFYCFFRTCISPVGLVPTYRFFVRPSCLRTEWLPRYNKLLCVCTLPKQEYAAHS
ncbi:unnamed protein product [Pylaiella littoralis]